VQVERGLVSDETRRTLAVRDVSLWGWLCIKGRHAEGAAQGRPADTGAEARYAMDWAGSAVSFLAESFLLWRQKGRP